jgi:hypothetical protein
MVTHMKAPVLLSIVLLAIAAPAHSQDNPQSGGRLEVTSVGKVLSLDDERQEDVKFWLQQLMLSALYHGVIEESSLGEWQQRLASHSRIHCVYGATATLAIPERSKLTFDEALMSTAGRGYPDFIFIKHGEHVLKLAKYDPWVLQKLVTEARLPPYPGLSGVQRQRF